MSNRTVTAVDEEIEDVDIEVDDSELEGVDIFDDDDDLPATDINADEDEVEPLDLAAIDTDDTALDRSIFSETALVLDDDIDLDQWLRLGANLERVRKGEPWWSGDWLGFGEDHFGEEAAQGLNAFQEGDPKTLSNRRWVSKQIPPDIRFEELSWSHHREAAVLDTKAQRKAALKKAIKEQWSSRDLGIYVKSQKAKNAKKGKGDDDAADTKAPKKSYTFRVTVTAAKEYQRIMTSLSDEFKAHIEEKLEENGVQDPKVSVSTS